MLGLPERRDKRDGFAVSAELTNFQYTQIDGVKPSEVDMKSLPYVCEYFYNSFTPLTQYRQWKWMKTQLPAGVRT
jgi:hypothetical protein